ncbi:MAG: acyl-ACP--UDP-N-acetylglucosamine O-acyltransferase [Gammaproteobacteria bacterium]
MIHPTAIIDPSAEVEEGVHVGPYSVIGPEVSIERGTRVASHVVITGRTRIGRDNEIFQFASLGDAPQDKKYSGEATELVIGDRNTIREYCTFNRGTVQDKGVTTIGDDNWIMAYVHVAHDCVVGDNTIFANCATLAGHVAVGDFAILGAFTTTHQFCRIGAYSFSAMSTFINKDVPPFVRYSGNPAEPHGINVEGMRRQGFSSDDITGLRRAYKTLYKSGLRLTEAVEAVAAQEGGNRALEIFSAWLQAESTRSVIR